MKRRTFLQKTGLAVAGGAAMPVGGQLSQAQAAVSQSAATTILITSSQTDLARALAARPGRRRVVLTAGEDVPAVAELRKGDLLDEKSVPALVQGINGIVHLAEPPAGATADAAIDRCTRGTYNLLQAAVQAGVTCAVYVSSLEVVQGYDDRFAVAEDWRPEPTTSPAAMSHYLGEFTCREFARDGRIGVAVLRLGKLVRPEHIAGKPFDPLWLAERDAVQAIGLALDYLEKQPCGHWAVFHIASEACRRFPIAKAKRVLGYHPEFNG